MITRRYVVHGRVQGVGFRWFVSRHATRLDLHGYARNLDDGSVEVLVQGPPGAVDELARIIGKGPSLAHVARVENADIPHDVGTLSTFETQ